MAVRAQRRPSRYVLVLTGILQHVVVETGAAPARPALPEWNSDWKKVLQVRSPNRSRVGVGEVLVTYFSSPPSKLLLGSGNGGGGNGDDVGDSLPRTLFQKDHLSTLTLPSPSPLTPAEEDVKL